MRLINWIKNKPTFFFIIGLITIIISIPSFIYIIRLNGGASLGAIFPMYAILISIPLIALDRFIVKMIKPIFLSIIEVIIVLIVIGYFKYENKTVVIDMDEGNQQYLLIKYDTCGYNINELPHLGLFNKRIKIYKDEFLIINRNSLSSYDVRINPPKNWKGYGYKSSGDIYDCKFDFYTGCIGTTNVRLDEMDSIINIKTELTKNK
jgi:hypothetical protein